LESHAQRLHETNSHLVIFPKRLGENSAARQRCPFATMKQHLKLNTEISIDLSLIAHSSDSIVITDSKANILWVNPSFEHLTSYSFEQAFQKPLFFLFGTFTDKEAIDRIQEAVQRGVSSNEEILLYRKSDEPFWVSLNLTPVRNEKHVFSHFIGVMRDITARKEVERQVARLQAQLAGMKYLDGWIVQCAWDKTVRDKKGQFISLEKFVERYTDARFSHGISPEARERVKKKKS
jgi:PAS domain S-box-containing protein